jgi:hypothetical protein
MLYIDGTQVTDALPPALNATFADNNNSTSKWNASDVAASIFLFILAGLFEIGGGKCDHTYQFL